MKALTQKMSKMEELMRGQSMSYSFDFDDMMQFDGDKLSDKFKMSQLQKFDGTRDPRIHLSQYTTTMSTTKAPMSVVARLFDHDMGYNKTKVLFSVIQNTSCFKDRSIEVFVSSTCFDWKNVS